MVAENSKLLNRLPILSLGISRKDDEFSIPTKTTFPIYLKKIVVDVESELTKIRKRYPKYDPPNIDSIAPEIASVQAMRRRLIGGISQAEEWDEYNSDLEQFYEKYEKHLSELGIIHEVRSRSFWFDLWITNDGSCPASDIDVSIDFPEPIRFIGKKGAELTLKVETLPDPPDPPKEPVPFPSTEIPYDGVRLYSIPGLPNYNDLILKGKNDFGSPWSPSVDITKIGDEFRRITVHLGKLKHGHPCRIGTFLAVFSPDATIRTFGSVYSISSTELATKQTGKMPFLINPGDMK